MKIFDFHLHPGYDFHNDELGYEITPEIFISGLSDAGVSRCAGSTIHKADFGRHSSYYKDAVPRLNRETYSFYERYSDIFVPGIHVDPNYPTLSQSEIEKYARLGVRLVGELIPENMGWTSYSDKNMIEILKLAGEYGMAISLHPTDIFDMEGLIRELHDTEIVIAHLDAYGLYEGSIELMKRYENVSFDISAHGIDRAGMIEDAVSRVGANRILYGSDYPGYSEHPFIDAVIKSAITDGEREAIFYGNAARILGI